MVSKPSWVKIQIKLACATFILTASSLSYGLTSSYSASANLKPPQIEKELNEQLIAKKSGGRSGGGSFRRKSSGSSPRRKSTRSKNKRPSSSSNKKQPVRSKNKRSSSPTYRREPSRTYREPEPSYRREPEPTYRNRTRNHRTYRRTYRSSSASMWLMLIFVLIFLLIVLLIIYALVMAVKKLLGKGNGNQFKERDNDIVTVSMLQVALLAPDNLQTDLSVLSTSTDTDTDTGLVTLMQETTLILLRNETAWTHVRSRSNSLNIDKAESVFDRLSIGERSKFTRETFTNLDGDLQISATAESARDDLAQYVVVTLILGTADDKPLFAKINTEAQLKEELLQIASMREDYLFRFELLWTPQASGEYLTDEELLLEYTDIMPLA